MWHHDHKNEFVSAEEQAVLFLFLFCFLVWEFSAAPFALWYLPSVGAFVRKHIILVPHCAGAYKY